MKLEADKVVISFVELAEEDPRVRPCHLGLYAVLLSQCLKGGGANPFPIRRDQIMRMAKFSSRSTYNQAMGDLARFGFIRYLPARSAVSSSQVFLKKLDN